jgi:hypothetical protein
MFSLVGSPLVELQLSRALCRNTPDPAERKFIDRTISAATSGNLLEKTGKQTLCRKENRAGLAFKHVK